MQSALKDIYNAQPEQLSNFDTFINFSTAGFTPGAINLPIAFNRAYIITKIKTCIGLFRPSDSSAQAWPNFEQFQLPLEFRAEIATASNSKTETLFNGLKDLYTDGSMHAHTFETPFTVLASNRQGAFIRVTISCNESLPNTVGSLSITTPTAPLVAFADGLLILEGYSMALSDYNKIAHKLSL